MKIREMSTYLLGTIFVTVITFILSLLHSYIFLPQEYGSYMMLYNIYILASLVLEGWMQSSIVRKSAEFEKTGNYEAFLANIYKSHLVISAFVVTTVIILEIFVPVSVTIKYIIVILSINFFFENNNNMLNSLFRYKGQASNYNKTLLIRKTGEFLIILVLAYIIGVRSVIILPFSILATEIIITMFWLPKLKKFFTIKYAFDVRIIKEIFLFGYPLIVNSLASWILNVSDRYIIKLFFSDREVGIYSYAYNMGNSITNLITQFIMLSAYPAIVKVWEKEGIKKAEETIAEYLKLFLLFCTPLMVGVSLLGGSFFNIFVGSEYKMGVNTFIYVCYATGVLGLTTYFNKAWELTKRTTGLLRLTLEAAAANVLLNFIFIPRFGYQAASVTTLIAYIVYLLLAFYRSRKIISIGLKYKTILNVMLCAAVMILYIKFVQIFIKNSNIFGFIFLICSSMVLYILGLFITKEVNIKKIYRQSKNEN